MEGQHSMGQVNHPAPNQHKSGTAQVFQSPQALAATLPKRRRGEQVEDALVRAPKVEAVEQQEPFNPASEWDPVVVRPIMSIPRTRIGCTQKGEPAWYTFTANKPVRVPACVARHLVEKGIVTSA